MSYGFLAGKRLPQNLAPIPLAHEAAIRARAQSLLTKDGKVGPLLPYRDALRVVERANKPRVRVTVPEPKESKEREVV